jgi:hypothetical protein
MHGAQMTARRRVISSVMSSPSLRARVVHSSSSWMPTSSLMRLPHHQRPAPGRHPSLVRAVQEGLVAMHQARQAAQATLRRASSRCRRCQQSSQGLARSALHPAPQLQLQPRHHTASCLVCRGAAALTCMRSGPTSHTSCRAYPSPCACASPRLPTAEAHQPALQRPPCPRPWASHPAQPGRPNTLDPWQQLIRKHHPAAAQQAPQSCRRQCTQQLHG